MTAHLLDSNGCKGLDSITVTINTCLGLDQLSGKLTFSVYPNPGAGQFYLDVEGRRKSVLHLSVTNLLGQIVYYQTLSSTDNNFFLDLNNLEAGHYFLSVKYLNKSESQKIIIEK